MKKILIIAAVSILIASCKKSTETLKPLSSYTLINATTDIANARAYAAENNITWKTLPATDAAAQYRSAHFSAWAGSNIIRAVSAADTNIALFSSAKAETFEQGKFNTLFLAGSSAAYEGIFINNDNIANHSDSVMGIRFINLSPNSSPISITLSTSPTTNEASNLAYKQKTDFKTYPALQSTAAIIFQLRDAGGILLASYTLPYAGSGTYATAGIANARFKNITLVIKGLQGTSTGTNAFGIFPVPHY